MLLSEVMYMSKTAIMDYPAIPALKTDMMAYVLPISS